MPRKIVTTPESGKCKEPEYIGMLVKLRWNAHLAKHSHFESSKSDRRYYIAFGVPIILTNIFLGSVFISLLGSPSATVPSASILWIGTVSAFFAACLSGIQTFFNFQRE